MAQLVMHGCHYWVLQDGLVKCPGMACAGVLGMALPDASRDGTAGCLAMPWPGDPVMPQLSALDTAQLGTQGWHSWVSEDGTDECLGLP